MLQTKRFQSNESQEVVSIIGESSVFYNLSNGSNIKKDIFFQKYSEMVDATNFFEKQSREGLQSLAEQIKTVDSRNAVDGNIEPSVKYLQQATSEQAPAPPEYRDMLIRKFEQEQANKDLSQYKVYESDDDAAADFERRQKAKQQPPPQRPKPPQYQDPYQQDEYSQPSEQTPITQHQQQPQQPAYLSAEEESFRFFKSFKRIHPIKVEVTFDEKIAEPDFIKMMVVNYEGDIIKYYTKEIMNRIYNDPGFLENKVYDKLKSIVFEEAQKKKRAPRKPKEVPVPPVKKPRAKKTNTDNG